MSTPKFTKRTAATSDQAAATPGQVKMSQRQRDRSRRALLKRRRQKSGQ
ncbi:MAG: hypothetical protein IPQ07_40615 [Myxococcales bacterium]|nr:hypothetical protein [Myxococcales bacterium]